MIAMRSLPPFCGDDRFAVGYDAARIAVLPVPYEGTVSYGHGTGDGPRAILEASSQMEMYDEELDRRIDEAGIFTLPPVDVRGADPKTVMARIRAAALRPLADGKLLVTLGGEHSVSYGPLAALGDAGLTPCSVLQIDAHGDLRDEYHGTPHSHASIMARVHELGLPFVQVGIRAVSAGERAFLRETGLEQNVFWGHRIAGLPPEQWVPQVLERLGDPVYLTIDVDGLDPSIMPATGTPEPGGLSWHQTLSLIRAVAAQRRIIALDLTELAPIPGQHAPDFLTARLAYKAMGYALQSLER